MIEIYTINFSRKKKKDEEIKKQMNEKLNDTIKTTNEESKAKHRKQKKLNDKAFEEWLMKKEQESLKKNTSLNSINNIETLPPFYPSSKTIPFGR